MTLFPLFYPMCLAAAVVATLCVNLAISSFESRNPTLFYQVAVVVIGGVTALAVVMR